MRLIQLQLLRIMKSESHGGAAARRQLQHGSWPQTPASSSQVRPIEAGGALCCFPAALKHPTTFTQLYTVPLFTDHTITQCCTPVVPVRLRLGRIAGRLHQPCWPWRYSLSLMLGLGLATHNSHWPWPGRLRFQRRLQAEYMDYMHTWAANLHAVASELEGARPVQPILVSSQLPRHEGQRDAPVRPHRANRAGYKRSRGVLKVAACFANLGLGLGMLAPC